MEKSHPFFQFKGNTVIVGIGNILRADDGIGPALIEKLEGRVKAVLINAGTAPENYTGKIVKLKPQMILIIDAVDLGLKPGEYEILEKSDIIKSGFTTHDMSPQMFIGYLEAETCARIYMLGVQPKDVSFGQQMSSELKNTLDELSGLLINTLKD